MKTFLLIILALALLSGCATTTPVQELTLVDGTVIRAQLVEE